MKIEKFKLKAKLVHNNKYNYELVNYINSRTKIIIICGEHGEFKQTPSNHLNGSKCPKCALNNRFLNNQKFKEEANKVHNFKYDYSRSEYINSRSKIIIICKSHGEYFPTANNHLQGSGCPKCANNIKFTNKEFIEKAVKTHGFKYDYLKVNYISNHIKITISCHDHGDFKQVASSHLQGIGCPKCSKKYKLTTEEFKEKSKLIHGDNFDYSKSIYTNKYTKLIISCKKEGHGEFLQSPSSHLSGAGCIKCAGNYNSNTQEFIEKANKIHNFKYDYSQVNYINDYTKIIIVCSMHKEFLQKPGSHLNGSGCSKCSKNVSNKEIKWLDSLNIPQKYRQAVMYLNGFQYKPDAFDISTNTIYEFYGDFWHGNPNKFDLNKINPCNKKTFGELYKKTLEREDLIKKAGYNLVTIWESDWN